MCFLISFLVGFMQFLRFYSFWQVHALFTCILYALIIIIIIIIIILFYFYF